MRLPYSFACRNMYLLFFATVSALCNQLTNPTTNAGAYCLISMGLTALTTLALACITYTLVCFGCICESMMVCRCSWKGTKDSWIGTKMTASASDCCIWLTLSFSGYGFWYILLAVNAAGDALAFPCTVMARRTWVTLYIIATHVCQKAKMAVVGGKKLAFCVVNSGFVHAIEMKEKLARFVHHVTWSAVACFAGVLLALTT